MESGIQSSFIPQDAAKPTVPRVSGGKNGLSDLLLLISIVMFVASLALGGAVFLYEQYMQTSSNSKVEQLKRAREAFEPALVNQLTRLDDRMHAADNVLGAHIAPTAFFHSLEQATLTTVSFKSMILEAPDPQHITIKMTGTAESVNSIALQADLFSKNGVVTSPIFSDISRQPDGVHFSLTALVNPAAINFVQLVNSLGVQGQAQPQDAQGPPSPFNGQQQDLQDASAQQIPAGQQQGTQPPQGAPAPTPAQ